MAVSGRRGFSVPTDLGRAWDELVRRNWKDLWGTGRSADAARNSLRAFFAAVQEELNRQRRAIEDMRRGAPVARAEPTARPPPPKAAPAPPPKPTMAPAVLDTRSREKVERILGHRFHNPRLLEEALAHPSFTYENAEIGLPSNYRLAFFGDALLGFLVSDALHSGFPDADQQALTEMRKRLVSRPALGRTAERLELGPFLILGRALEVEGRKNKTILAETLEALVAAIYLDAGLDAAQAFVLRILGTDLKKPAPARAPPGRPPTRRRSRRH